MTDGQAMPPGWYYASGDPEGTRRYWDGSSWTGEPTVWNAPTSDPATGLPAPSASEQLAGLTTAWRRIGASFLDGLVQFLIFGIPVMIVLFVLLSDAFAEQSFGDRFDESLRTGEQLTLQSLGISRGWEYAITFIPGVLGFLWQWLWDAIKGGTPGKLMTGIRIVAEGETGPPGYMVSLKRNSVYLLALIPLVGSFISGILWLISLILLFADSKRQTVMDKFANTVVLHKEYA